MTYEPIFDVSECIGAFSAHLIDGIEYLRFDRQAGLGPRALPTSLLGVPSLSIDLLRVAGYGDDHR